MEEGARDSLMERGGEGSEGQSKLKTNNTNTLKYVFKAVIMQDQGQGWQGSETEGKEEV